MFASPAMRFVQGWIASKVLWWCLQVLRWGFTQGWIASKVLQWWLSKGGSQAKSSDDVHKSCDGVYPRVDREQSPAMIFAQGWIAGWLRDNCATLLNQDRSATGTMAVQGTVKGGLCWWQQMGIAKRRFRLIVRLKAIEYYEGFLCYLPSLALPSSLLIV